MSGLKVCVVVGWATKELRLEIGEMLLDVFRSSGFLPTLVGDDDQDVMEADVLLLFGDCLNFDSYIRLLKRWAGRKPTTILWQTEPLPPPTISERAEEIGLQAAKRRNLSRLSQGGFSSLVRSIVPFPALYRVRQIVDRMLFLGYKKETTKDPHQQILHGIDATRYYVVMLRYWWIKSHLEEGWLDYVFGSTVPKKEFLTSRGIPAEWAPVGYHPILGEDLGIERDIDVLFFGSLFTPRRKAALGALLPRLESKGLSPVIVDGGYYGKKRTELLNRTRINIYLANYPWELPGIRFAMNMGCGSLLVSEKLGDSTPYEPGVHFVQASVDDMPDVITYYLAHKAERDKIVRSAHNFVTKELTIQNTIKQIMGVCGADSPLPASDMRRGH